jgi:hypothetical protein
VARNGLLPASNHKQGCLAVKCLRETLGRLRVHNSYHNRLGNLLQPGYNLVEIWLASIGLNALLGTNLQPEIITRHQIDRVSVEKSGKQVQVAILSDSRKNDSRNTYLIG